MRFGVSFVTWALLKGALTLALAPHTSASSKICRPLVVIEIQSGALLMPRTGVVHWLALALLTFH